MTFFYQIAYKKKYTEVWEAESCVYANEEKAQEVLNQCVLDEPSWDFRLTELVLEQ